MLILRSSSSSPRKTFNSSTIAASCASGTRRDASDARSAASAARSAASDACSAACDLHYHRFGGLRCSSTAAFCMYYSYLFFFYGTTATYIRVVVSRYVSYGTAHASPLVLLLPLPLIDAASCGTRRRASSGCSVAVIGCCAAPRSEGNFTT